MEKISIIANFYKSEKYIPRLFRSVVDQTYSNWELIAVNDCSPGKDAEILAKLVVKYHVENKVKIINNPHNLGIRKAKEVGMHAATGEYVTFIDGDDYFSKNALELLIAPMCDEEVDMVVGDSVKFLPGTGYRHYVRNNIKEECFVDGRCKISGSQWHEDFFINFFGVNIYNSAYWGKLYRRSVLENLDVHFVSGDISEDQHFSLAVHQKVNTVVFIRDIVYHWRWGGFTSGKKNDLYNGTRFIYANADYYIYRLELIDKYMYYKAIRPLAVEARNVLTVAISELTAFPVTDSRVEPIKKEIERILKHPAYVHVKGLVDANPGNYTHPVFVAIARMDIDAIYKYCYEYYKSHRMKRFLRKVLHGVLYFF